MDMKEALTKEFIEGTLTALRTTKDFASEQSPLVLDEVLRWGLAQSSIDIVVFLVIFVMAGKTIHYLWTEVKHWQDGNAIAFGVSFCALMISSAVIICNVTRIAKIWFAPRLFLIDYFTSLLKSGS